MALHPLWEEIDEANRRAVLPMIDPNSIGARLANFNHAHLQDIRLDLEDWCLSLFYALNGYEAPLDDGKYHDIQRFVLSGPVGMTLGSSAAVAQWGSARSRELFRASSRLPGFMTAVEKVSNILQASIFRNGVTEDWRQIVKRTFKLSGETKAHDDYWLKVADDEAGDPREFYRASMREVARVDDADRKRRERGKEPHRTEFKDTLKNSWIPMALWCRSTKGLLGLLAPDSKDGVRSMRAIDKEISRLKLSGSRRSEHEALIEKVDLGFL